MLRGISLNGFQFIRLLFTAAIWGASHVFSRVIVPAIGPELSVFGRVVIGVVTLSIILGSTGELYPIGSRFREHWRHFLIVGLLSMALPFFLFAYAAIALPASYLVILNATVPIFSAVISSWLLKEPFDWRRWVSIVLGLSGVVLLTEYGSIEHITREIALSLVAGLLASASYGCGALYIGIRVKHIPPTQLVWGSNSMAAGMLFAFAVSSLATHGDFHGGPHGWWWVGVSLFLLGAFSSGIAFVIFYQLVAEIGPFNASLTTFVMPLFGILWGVLFLGETVTWGMGAGALLVIGSAAMFVRRR